MKDPKRLVLVSGSEDTTVRVWDLSRQCCTAVLKAHLSYVTSMAFLPGGAGLVTGGRDRVVNVWNLELKWWVGCCRLCLGWLDETKWCYQKYKARSGGEMRGLNVYCFRYYDVPEASLEAPLVPIWTARLNRVFLHMF